MQVLVNSCTGICTDAHECMQVELDGCLLPEVHTSVVFKETGASNSVYMKVGGFTLPPCRNLG